MAPNTPLTMKVFLERLRDVASLEQIEGTDGLDRQIRSPNISSPGLVLAGYVERFPANRIQVLGETEITYLASLSLGRRQRGEVGDLRLAQDLDAVGRETLDVAGEDETRTRDVGASDLPIESVGALDLLEAGHVAQPLEEDLHRERGVGRHQRLTASRCASVWSA